MNKRMLTWVPALIVVIAAVVAVVVYRAELAVWFQVPGPEVAPVASGHAGHGAPGSEAAAEPSGEEVAYYTCPMHNSVRAKQPGKCPICGMDLQAVTHQELGTGTIVVDAKRRQLIGVRTEPVERRELVRVIRAVGLVKYDETLVADVSLKYRGWVGELFADYTGKRVEKGQPLLTIYSPELRTAQLEYRDALATGRSDTLRDSSRTKLLLWDVTEEQIKELEQGGELKQYIPVLAPMTGTVIEKHVVRGSAVEAGSRIYRIADFSTVWIEAELYESELPLVEAGKEVDVTLTYLPGQSLTGKISYIYPYLDPTTRRGRVRIEAENASGLLKPDMYAQVHFEIPLGKQLAVPEDAILYGGDSRVVFVDLGDGHFRPQRIQIGQRAGDYVQVLEGLKEGDVIVTSGNFLIAAESKLKSGIEKW